MAWLWKRPAHPAVHAPCIDRHGDPRPAGATVRLGTGRLQYRGRGGYEGLSALAFSPDGTLLAGAGRDGRVSRWGAATGQLLRVLGRHEAEVNCLAFSPDGRLLVTGGRDGQAILWNAAAGTCIYQAEADRVDVAAVAFSLCGDTWAAANSPSRPTVPCCQAGATVISVDGDGTVRCHFIREPIGNLYAPDFERCLVERPCSNDTCGYHIGYVHLDRLRLYETFGDGVLEHVPVGYSINSPRSLDDADI